MAEHTKPLFGRLKSIFILLLEEIYSILLFQIKINFVVDNKCGDILNANKEKSNFVSRLFWLHSSMQVLMIWKVNRGSVQRHRLNHMHE